MDSAALNATFPHFDNQPFFNCTGISEGFRLWSAFSLLTVVFGTPFCVWVLWDLVVTLTRGDQPCTPYILFTLNAAAMDLVFIALLPFDIINFYVWKNPVILSITYLSFSLNFCGRPLLTTCLCLDCYMAVLHPHRYRSPSLSTRTVIAALIWLASLMSGVVLIKDSNALANPGMWWPFLSGLAVIVYCDCRLLWTLRRSALSRGEPQRQKKRALDTIFVSLVITVTLYLPPMLAITLGSLLYHSAGYYCLIVLSAAIPIQYTSVFMSIHHLCKVGKLNGIKSKFCK